MLMTELVPSLQKLVDARLDNIERALMFTDTTRAERRQIVSAVEEQILEMLERLSRDEPSREDVLSILAQLDPPEAYVGTVASHPLLSPGRDVPSSALHPNGTASAKFNGLAIAAVTLATLSAVAAAGWWLLDLPGLILVFLFAFPASVLGIVAICQVSGSRKHQKGLWMAIVGAASPAISLAITSLAYMALLVMES